MKNKKFYEDIDKCSAEKDVVFSPRRKKVKGSEQLVLVHDMMTVKDFNKQCDAGKEHYGKKMNSHNPKHLQTILEVSVRGKRK